MSRVRNPEELIRELREVNEQLLLAGVRERELAEEREKLLERAQEADQAKTDFLAVISHELKTPLTAIMGYTDVLEAEVSGPLADKQKEQLGRIRASANHLLQLIDQVLTFSHMETDRVGVQIDRVDLSDLIRDASRITEPLFTAKRVDFEVHAPKGTTPIETDRRKVRQILINLLSNAAKFTDRGEVALRGCVEDDTVIFQVRDTGSGIPPEEVEHIFEPFRQLDEPLTRRAGGTGLGLAVARRLARLLGGDVDVESTVGEGSTFTVRLPRRMAAPASPATEQRHLHDQGAG